MSGVVKRLFSRDIDAILNLERSVQSEIGDSESYVVSQRSYFSMCLPMGAIALGIYCDDALVAFALVSFPLGRGDNLGDDLGLPDDEIGRVAQIEKAVVHPNWRRMGMHSHLVDRIAKMAESMNYKHLVATVSPNNPASIKVALNARMWAEKFAFKYGGMPRFIFHRDLLCPSCEIGSDRIEVPLGDYQRVRDELDLGRRGIELCSAGTSILLAR